MIKIKSVDEMNFMAVVQLDLTPAQKEAKWLANNAFSLAQCWLYRESQECFPNAIYWGKEVVGFVLFEIESGSQELLIWRIMIGQQFQGKGYGRKALETIIKEASVNYPERTIVADYVEGNEPMKHLLSGLGFQEVGYNEEYQEYILHFKHRLVQV